MKNKIEPYQPFFFSGLLISMMGLGVWLFFQMGWLQQYPMQEHGFLMIMGFLLSYISGFLMTAVPKMSQTQSAAPWEMGGGLLLLWTQVVIALSGNIRVNYLLGAFQLCFLLFFIFRRLIHKKANPPTGFVFLPFGLGAGILGCLFLYFADWGLSPEMVILGKSLLYQAFPLNLIMGLGSRLVPSLTRVQGALDVRLSAPEKVSTYVSMAVFLNLGFLAEAFLSPQLGQLIKFLVIAWMAIQKFKVWKPRQVKGHLGTGIRISVHFLALGFLLAGIFPAYGIHFLHLSYIGGFALLTFMISTRVVLAHGGYDLTLELKSVHLIFFFSLVALVALLRAALGFESSFRVEFIWALSLAWIFLVSLWGHFYLGKLWKSQS